MRSLTCSSLFHPPIDASLTFHRCSVFPVPVRPWVIRVSSRNPLRIPGGGRGPAGPDLPPAGFPVPFLFQHGFESAMLGHELLGCRHHGLPTEINPELPSRPANSRNLPVFHVHLACGILRTWAVLMVCSGEQHSPGMSGTRCRSFSAWHARIERVQWVRRIRLVRT